MNNKTMNSKDINSGLKTATLINNKTMNNDYRTYTLDPPVQHNRSETYVETPRMRSSTRPTEIKSGLKTATLVNNKTMNSKESNSGLNRSILMNNNSMNNFFKERNSSLNRSILMNNNSMNNFS